MPEDQVRSTRAADMLLPLLVFAAVFLAFLPSLRNGFVGWDDDRNIEHNENYRGLGAAQLKWMFTTFHMGPYQPLSWMTLGADYLIGGTRPFGYHLTNVLLHALAAVLLMDVAARLIRLRA